MPRYGYSGASTSASPRDPQSNDPKWKDITDDCKRMVDELLRKAEEEFGRPIKDPPVRVTEFSQGPRTNFINGVAYIRIPPGVSSNERELRSQIAHEIVHVLSGDVPNTVLEEGLCVYFAVKHAGAFEPHASDPNQEKYNKAYELVRELLNKCPTAIKQLRDPPRSLDNISADEIRKVCPDYTEKPAKRLVAKF